MIGRTNSYSGEIMASFLDGATATPLNDVATWLKTYQPGGLSNKGYTTLAQVIADTTTLSKLMADENAMKYLARSTGFATTACSNDIFMIYLGASMHVDSTVLNSDLWVSEIEKSQYMDKVFVDLIPYAMTSNTAPKGEVIFGSAYSPDDYCPYYTFDKTIALNNDIFISGLSDVTNAFIGYKFEKAVIVKKIKYVSRGNTISVNNGVPKGYSIEASNDGKNWTNIGTFENLISPKDNKLISFEQSLINNTKYLFYRMKANSLYGNYFAVNELYFYGR